MAIARRKGITLTLTLSLRGRGGEIWARRRRESQNNHLLDTGFRRYDVIMMDACKAIIGTLD